MFIDIHELFSMCKDIKNNFMYTPFRYKIIFHFWMNSKCVLSGEGGCALYDCNPITNYFIWRKKKPVL